MLIDSHCHLTSPGLFDRVDALLAVARQAGVSHAITIGVDVADGRRVLELAATHDELFAAVGIHPHEAGKVADGWATELDELAGTPRAVAIGEMGLDYHYDFAPRAQQAAVFEAQLELATQLGKPVIIHCREAHADVMAILARFPRLRGVVFHCFTGTDVEAREILDRGYWISLTGVVTFKKSDALREVARFMPQDRLMVETDSPYLSPEPVRNQQSNHPANVVHVARRLAEVRGLAFADFVAITRFNTVRFFSLPVD